MEKELGRTFTEAPSFGRTGEAVTDYQIVELEIAGDDDDRSMNDFEFASTMDESGADALTKAVAGEIFSNGRVLLAYPVFNRNLVADTDSFDSSPEQELVESVSRLALPLEKHDLRSGSASSSSSIYSEADDPATYCASTPISAPHSPNRWRMSQSTGLATSEFRSFRLRDLFISRSRSDGKEKMAFPTVEKEMESGGFCPIPSRRGTTEAERKAKNGKGKVKGRDVKEIDVVTAHRIYYGKGAAVARRSFLPYRLGVLGGYFGHEKHPV